MLLSNKFRVRGKSVASMNGELLAPWSQISNLRPLENLGPGPHCKEYNDNVETFSIQPPTTGHEICQAN